jgi:hypothetical protein
MSEKIPQIAESHPTLPAEQMDKATNESFEEELSPEVIEKIMEKVQDINQEGTAYSVIGATRGPGHADALNESVLKYDLPNVLKSGLLGQPIPYEEGFSFEEWWKHGTRERDNQVLHFNIVGRSYERVRMRGSYFWNPDSTGIIFDISQFQEQTPGWKRGRKIKNFCTGGPDMWRDWQKYFGDLELGDEHIKAHPKFLEALKSGVIDKEGRPLPHTEYGFTLFSRVAPRYFRGLVLGNKYTEDDLKQIINQMEQVYQGKENLLLPIHDDKGNLLWPKQMSYEEVKKLVAEREERENKKK